MCGNSNDGDGIALVNDGKSTSPGYGCNDGFSTTSQGIVVNVNTDQDTTGSVSISTDTEGCSLGSDDVAYISGSKVDDFNEGIVRVYLTESEIKVNYQDLNPANGYKTGTISYSIWNPNGYGYLMIGASTGCSNCGAGWCGNDDSDHWIDWIRVRKYGQVNIEYSSNTITLQQCF